ncbi:MAG: HAMP domain-containing sensor histidine kinase [bacterium]
MTPKRKLKSINSPKIGGIRRILLIRPSPDLVAHFSTLDGNRWTVEEQDGWSETDEYTLTILDGNNIMTREVINWSGKQSALYLADPASVPEGLPESPRLLMLPRETFLASDANLIVALLTQAFALTEFVKHLESKFRPYLRQAQLGAALQGFVHNVNNKMTSLLALLELLRRDNRHLKDLEVLEVQCRRLHADFANLLRVSQRDLIRDKSSFDLNALIREELQLMMGSDPLLRSRVVCKTELDANLPAFYGIYSDFSHSFVNLVRNAMNAMANATNPELVIRTGQKAQTIWLEVEDHGIGIPQQFMEDIFKPYVRLHSSRNEREETGLGLGLFTSRELLEKYGVKWSVESRLGEGTKFLLDFPKQRVCQSPETPK